MNALLHHYPELQRLPRAGLVHRLDKDTSGLLVVARSERAHTSLVRQLQARSMGREYQAVTRGLLLAGGRIDAPLGRHPVDRKRMAVVPSGRHAVTHFRVVERYLAHTLVRVRLETGRTHQIRVHFAHMRHPLVGDPVYGGRGRCPSHSDETLRETLRAFNRQALHARRLILNHPGRDQPASWESPLPPDLAALIDALRKHAGGGERAGA
jgi:23S rRNA pseudouridine1911/1915/1917 synthase